MITYQVERWTDITSELSDLFEKHWHEVALNHDEIKLDVAWDKYAAMCLSGNLHVVTVRSDGVLVGYHVAYVDGHMHYKSTIHACVDIYFIAPEFRNGRVGLKMFEFVEEDLRRLGVKKIITATKIHLNHSRLFEHLGYTNTEITFTKLL